MYICQSQSPKSSYSSTLLPPGCPYVCSLRLCLYFCFVNKIICTIFLDSTYMGCCCCCQVASVMSNSVRPHRQQPTRLCRPWDSSGENTGVGCHFLLHCVKVKVKLLSRDRLVATPWNAAHQVPPSMGFSRQEYWSGLPLSY